MKYVIKCDDCKQEIGQTDSLSESAAGGRCEVCQSTVYSTYLPCLAHRHGDCAKVYQGLSERNPARITAACGCECHR